MTGKRANTDRRLRIGLARRGPGAGPAEVSRQRNFQPDRRIAPARSRHLVQSAGVLTSLLLVGCGPSPNFESAGIGRTGVTGAGEVSIPVPPGENGSGDLLVAILGAPGNPNTSGPEGWTSVPGFGGFNGALCQSDGQGTACQLTVFYKIADGSESTASFSWGGRRQAAAAVVRFSNVDVNEPIGAVDQQRGSSDTPRAPTIDTTRDGSRALRIAVGELDEAGRFLRGAVALADEPPSSRLSIVSFPPRRKRSNERLRPAAGLVRPDRARRRAGGVGHPSRVDRSLRSRLVGARRRRPVAHRHDRDQAAGRVGAPGLARRARPG